MRVRDLGARPVSDAVRELSSRIALPRERSGLVERRKLPYWEEHGWNQLGNDYSGTYQTPYGSFLGHVRRRGTTFEFFILTPPAALQRHSHWTCFQPRRDGWYSIHMAHQPKDASSGIIAVERILTEAFEE